MVLGLQGSIAIPWMKLPMPGSPPNTCPCGLTAVHTPGVRAGGGAVPASQLGGGSTTVLPPRPPVPVVPLPPAPDIPPLPELVVAEDAPLVAPSTVGIGLVSPLELEHPRLAKSGTSRPRRARMIPPIIP